MPSYIFNTSESPSIFGHMTFRVAYTLLPAIRNMTLNSNRNKPLNVISIACGTALELSCFELLSRSRNIKINYLGCDINKDDLKFNYQFFKRRANSVTQQYLLADLAVSPPIQAISNADCILWRHPEFLSDHLETPKSLILKMAAILWNILQNKNKHSSLLITCYEPHEMMLVIELTKLFCENNVDYTLTIDKQEGRASITNPYVDAEDEEPLFNLNNHDQFQLTISHCSPTKETLSNPMLSGHLSNALQTIICKVPTEKKSRQHEILRQLVNVNLDTFRSAASFLNDEMREHDHPLIKRDELISILSEKVEQPGLTP